MPQLTILNSNSNFYVYSWTTGVMPCRIPTKSSEDDVLARALWLVRNGREDEADVLLEKYCTSATTKV